jgi:hydrogenase maturation factor
MRKPQEEAAFIMRDINLIQNRGFKLEKEFALYHAKKMIEQAYAELNEKKANRWSEIYNILYHM